jgi:heme/copper-type cytochrome/quinol oxidase subunit 2
VTHSFQIGQILKAVAVVLLLTGLFVWGMWSVGQSAERAERDARYRRRHLLRLGALYFVVLIAAVTAVVTGNESKLVLAGVPICLLMGWWLVRNARNVNLPPA